LFELERKLYLVNISVEGVERPEENKGNDGDDGKGDDDEDNSGDNYDDLDDEHDHMETNKKHVLDSKTPPVGRSQSAGGGAHYKTVGLLDEIGEGVVPGKTY
jgi:hypothetical protein